MDIVILCAGQGTRMNSSVPKALTLFQGKPFIDHIVSKCQSLTFHHLYIILQSKEKDHFEHLLHPYQVRYIYQDQALGTGHALQCLFQQVSYSDISDSLLILNGDMPNIYIPMIQEMINQTSNVLACRLENPYGYGRIEWKNHHLVIVEQKDITPSSCHNSLCNMGVYYLDKSQLYQSIFLIQNQNRSKEYYLTDIFSFYSETKLFECHPSYQHYFYGINTPTELRHLEKMMQ